MNDKFLQIEAITSLVCELTRNCGIKDESFAASFNLNPAEVRFLKLFVNRSAWPVKSLKDSLGLTPGRITHIVSSLEARKLVKRTPDPSDQRNVIVSLTSRAIPLVENLYRKYVELHHDMLETVDKEKLKTIHESLQTLTGVLNTWIHEDRVPTETP